MSADGAAPDGGDQPVLKVVSGNVTAEEIAAILALLAASGDAVPTPTGSMSRWAGRTSGGWKGSAFPGTARR
ncbi:MAG: acyl-CoA carboxylase epsilon subunit [Allobranchiibius sp.]